MDTQPIGSRGGLSSHYFPDLTFIDRTPVSLLRHPREVSGDESRDLALGAVWARLLRELGANPLVPLRRRVPGVLRARASPG